MKKIKVGTQILVDGNTWAVVESVLEDGGILVCDQDGAEMEITASRITHIY